MATRAAWLVVGALVWGGAACSDDDAPAAICETGCDSEGNPIPTGDTGEALCLEGSALDQEACLTAHYFAGYQPRANPACAGFSPSTLKIAGRREVSLFRAPVIFDDALVTQGHFLQRFYQDYELSFFTRERPQGVAFTYAMNGTDEAFSEAVSQAGIAPGQEPTPAQEEQVNKLIADLIYGTIRDFIRAQSEPVMDRVNIVVLPKIASPDVAKLLKGVIGGLGLSPRLLRDLAVDDPSSNLFELLSLPADFTPTLFVGHNDTLQLAKNPEGLVAHEMGHAMGLQHTLTDGNVMKQGQTQYPCASGLTDAQVNQLRESADSLLDDPIDFEASWRALSVAHRQAVSIALQRRRAQRP